MAAPSGISWGNIYGDYGRIGIYSKVTTSGTTATVNVQVWFWSKYSVTDANNIVYYDVGTDVTEAVTNCGTVNIKHTVSSGDGWSTSNQTKLIDKTYTYTMSKSAVKYKVYARHKNVEMVGTSMYKSTSFTVPAKPSYAVTYNANGGSGAPAAQTKWYGETLKLQTSKPTRTGYTFQGWGTTAADTSVNYAAGANYTSNAAITLYAIWKQTTYSIKYDVNGGSGSFSTQTKTYGVAINLWQTEPTRTGYTFQGWGTAETDTTAKYAAGASYTSNASVTLYAVWKLKTYSIKYDVNGGSGSFTTQTKTHDVALNLWQTKPTRENYSFVEWNTNDAGTGTKYAPGGSYTANAEVTLYAIWSLDYLKPRITGFSITRCDDDGNASDSGTKYKLKFNWATDYADPTLTIELKATGDSEWSWNEEDLSETSGAYESIKGAIEADSSYDVRITLADSGGSTQKIDVINSSYFTIDYLDGGKGVAFGKAAEIENAVEFNLETLHRQPVEFEKGVAFGKAVEHENVVESVWDIRSKENIMTGNKTGYSDGKTGVYLDNDGFIQIQRSSNDGHKPYVAFLSDDSTELEAQVRLNPETKQLEMHANGNGCLVADALHTNDIKMNKGKYIFATDPDGTLRNILALSSSPALLLGYNTHPIASTYIYGKDLYFYVGNDNGDGVSFKPYLSYESGSINIVARTSGYITNSSKDLFFEVPLARPLLTGTIVTAATRDGFYLRQNGQYTHGSTATTPTTAVSSYEVSETLNFGLTIKATLSNTTNAINNAPIGVYWVGTLIFS